MLHSSKVGAELHGRQDNGQWPREPLHLVDGDDVHLESIGFTAPLAAFYRTSGMSPPGDLSAP